jgi:hypothetical protein
MPVVLFSFKKTPDGGVMFHGFFAPNERAAEKKEQGHAVICPQFGPALKAGETIEQLIDVDEIPEFDEESIGAWLDEQFGLEDEDEEEEEDDDEVVEQEEEF